MTLPKTLVACFLAALGANAQSSAPTAKCSDSGGKPCTAAQVQDVNRGIGTGRRQYATLELVKSVELAGPDGTLRCVQNNGSACTAAQLDAVAQIASKQRYAINYNSSKSNSGNVTAQQKSGTGTKSTK